MDRSGQLTPARVVFTPIRADSGVLVPTSCGALLWRLGDALGLSVIAKATFSLEHRLMTTTSSEPIHCVDHMHPTRGLVIAPNDLVPRKAQVDVVAWGRAVRPETPAGRDARAITVGLALTQSGQTIAASYTRAVGEPSGFGPEGFTAPSRQALLGDLELTHGGDGALVIPAALSPVFFQCAPAAQRVDTLAVDATFTLVGMHPARPTVTAQLPSAMAQGVAFGLGKKGAATPLVFRADTVVIDADRMTCSVVWRAELGLVAVAQLPDVLIAAGVSTHEHALTLPRTRPQVAAESNNLDATVMFGDSGARDFESTVAVSAEALTGAQLPFDPKAPPAALAWAKKTAENRSAPKGGTALVTGRKREDAPLPFGKKTGKSTDAGRMAAWARALEAGGNSTQQPASKPGKTTLPFDTAKNVKAPKPAADAWVQATGAAKGGTAVVFGKQDEGSLPFDDDLQKQRELALQAEQAAKEAQAAEAVAALERKEAEKAAREMELANQRREEEKQRFEEEQERLRKLEAERKRAAHIKAEQDAADLQNALYGGFSRKP